MGNAKAAPAKATVAPKVAGAAADSDGAILRAELVFILGETLTDRDTHMLDELVQWWGELKRVKALLREAVPGEAAYNRLLRAATMCATQLERISQKFGLTPGDRAKLRILPSGPPVAKVPTRPRTRLDTQGPPK